MKKSELLDKIDLLETEIDVLHRLIDLQKDEIAMLKSRFTNRQDNWRNFYVTTGVNHE